MRSKFIYWKIRDFFIKKHQQWHYQQKGKYLTLSLRLRFIFHWNTYCLVRYSLLLPHGDYPNPTNCFIVAMWWDPNYPILSHGFRSPPDKGEGRRGDASKRRGYSIEMRRFWLLIFLNLTFSFYCLHIHINFIWQKLP